MISPQPTSRTSRKIRLLSIACAIPFLTSACAAVHVREYTSDPRDVTVTEESAALTSNWTPQKGKRLHPLASRLPVKTNQALDYLLTVRLEMIKKAEHRENLDTGTKVVQDIGISTAILKTTSKKPGEAIVNLLVGAGLAAKINADTNPLVLSTVYRAGVNNLDCIRSASVLSHSEVLRVKDQLGMRPGQVELTFAQTGVSQDIDSAISAINADIRALQNAAYDSKDEAAIIAASQAIKAAQKTQREMTSVLSEEKAAEKVANAVEATKLAVDKEAKDKSPTPARILANASEVGRHVSLGVGLQKRMDEAYGAVEKATVTSTRTTRAFDGQPATSAEQFRKNLARDVLRLKSAITQLPSVSIDDDLKAISSCRFTAIAIKPVTVTPAEFSLAGGGPSAKVVVVGTPDFWVDWAAGAPTGVTWSPIETGVEFQADKTAEAGVNEYRIGDALGYLSQTGKITVTAAPSEQPPKSEGAAASDSSTNSEESDGDGPAESPGRGGVETTP